MYLYIYLVCDDMIYGLECVLFCGNCSDEKMCYYVNGICWSDCDIGV